MPIQSFTFIPTNLREWSAFFQKTSVTPDANAVTHGMLQASDGCSVIGRAASTLGNVDDIIATADGQFFGRRAGVVGAFSLDDADIPSTIARDSEVTSAIAAHVALSDPHTQYAQEATGTFTGTLTGCTTSPTATLRYTKAGNVVVLYIPAISATSNSTSMTVTGGPVEIQPVRAQRVQVPVQDNGSTVAGLVQVETSGTLTFYVGVSAGAFTGAGTKGTALITITYSLE